MMEERVHKMTFASIYPLYLNKAIKKGKTKDEVDKIIFWLTGYNNETLNKQLESNASLKTFFLQAPLINPNASLIKGVICGVRVEDIQDDIVRYVRYLDKLIDELAKGRSMEKILR